MANLEQFDKVESKPIHDSHSGANLDRKSYYDGISAIVADKPNLNPVKDGQINFSNIFEGMKGIHGDKPPAKEEVQLESNDGRKPAARSEEKARHEAPPGHGSHDSHVVSPEQLAKDAEAAAKANGSHESHHAHSMMNKFRKELSASMRDAFAHGGLSGVFDLQQKANEILNHKDGAAPFIGSEYKHGNVNFSLSHDHNGARQEWDFKQPIKNAG